MHSPHERTETASRKATPSPAPKIYYLHPLLAGPLANWERHIARCRRMGFSHLATAPLFAPGGTGDIFLAADHESANPALGADEPVDAVITRLADMCAREGLGLILDIVIDRVASEGARALGQDVVASSRDGVEKAADAIRSLAEAKSPTEYLQLQSEFARASFDRAVAESSRLTESLVKLAGEAFQPLSNRASANAERFNTLVA